MSIKQQTLCFLLCTTFFLRCAKNDNFSLPTFDCIEPTVQPNTTLEQLQQLADASIRIYPGPATDVLSGIVISSDEGGNFYNKLHIVDETTQLPALIQLEMASSYTEFPLGTKITLTLGGLYSSYAYGKLSIGGGIYTSSTGKKYMGSIAKNAVNTYLQKYCQPVDLQPYTTTLSLAILKQETDNYLGRLIQLENVQFDRTVVGKKLYDPDDVDAQGYTLRKLVDAQGNSLYIRTGKLSKDFVDYVIPPESGRILGLVDVFSKQLQFYPRVLADLNFDQPPLDENGGDTEEPDETVEITVEPGQLLAFPGADFEQWEDFISKLKRPGLKFATQAPEEGWNNSTGLAFRGIPSKTDNAFTLQNISIPEGVTALSFLLKGTAHAKSLSINLYQANGAYVAYNLGDLNSSKHITPTTQTNQQGNVNKYKGTIDTKGQWIKVILDLQDVDYNTTGTGDFLTIRFGGQTATLPSAYDLIVDELRFETALTTE